MRSWGCGRGPAGSAALPPSAVWQVINALGQAISQTPGCVLLDVDAGASTNRTVYTFVGSPEAVVEGALSAARVAGQLIDMSRHTGELGGGAGADLVQSIPWLQCVAGAKISCWWPNMAHYRTCSKQCCWDGWWWDHAELLLILLIQRG